MSESHQAIKYREMTVSYKTRWAHLPPPFPLVRPENPHILRPRPASSVPKRSFHLPSPNPISKCPAPPPLSPPPDIHENQKQPFPPRRSAPARHGHPPPTEQLECNVCRAKGETGLSLRATFSPATTIKTTPHDTHRDNDDDT